MLPNIWHSISRNDRYFCARIPISCKWSKVALEMCSHIISTMWFIGMVYYSLALEYLWNWTFIHTHTSHTLSRSSSFSPLFSVLFDTFRAFIHVTHCSRFYWLFPSKCSFLFLPSTSFILCWLALAHHTDNNDDVDKKNIRTAQSVRETARERASEQKRKIERKRREKNNIIFMSSQLINGLIKFAYCWRSAPRITHTHIYSNTSDITNDYQHQDRYQVSSIESNQFQYMKMLLLAAQIELKDRDRRYTEEDRERRVANVPRKWEYLCWWCQAQWAIGWFWQIVEAYGLSLLPLSLFLLLLLFFAPQFCCTLYACVIYYERGSHWHNII